jgi:hypothetical protein
MGTPVEITYTFDTSDDFPGLKKDLTIFVHFLDPRNVIRFVDDHHPPTRTNQWLSAGHYTYNRTYFIPENIPEGKYKVELGMYTPSGKGERFVLNAKPLSERSYEVGEIKVVSPSERTQNEYVSGWYDVEKEPDDNWYHWRWTSRSALVRAPNPNRDSYLYIKADTQVSRFQEPPNVTVILNGETLDEFTIESESEFVKRYEIRKAELGSEDQVEIGLTVDQTFTPALAGNSQDIRELGLKVYCVYLGPSRE